MLSFDAPVHVVLRRFKVIQIAVLLFFIFLTWDMTLFYKGVALQLQEWQVTPIFAYLTALIATIKYCFESLSRREENDHDGHD